MFTGRRHVLLRGSYQGFANYYRFSTVEATDPNHASRANSWIVSGLFVGSCLAQAALSLGALALIAQVRLKPGAVAQTGKARPLRQILALPPLGLMHGAKAFFDSWYLCKYR